jgi:hypothetical protein
MDGLENADADHTGQWLGDLLSTIGNLAVNLGRNMMRDPIAVRWADGAEVKEAGHAICVWGSGAGAEFAIQQMVNRGTWRTINVSGSG